MMFGKLNTCKLMKLKAFSCLNAQVVAMGFSSSRRDLMGFAQAFVEPSHFLLRIKEQERTHMSKKLT